jgi:exopolysaccharide biosynthesis predicted pyruvyltransferase EpsI
MSSPLPVTNCITQTEVLATGPTLRQQSRLPPTNVDALLVWPRGGNYGDRLIVDASERYLKDRGIKAWRSDGSVEDAALAGDADYLRDLFSTFRGMVMFPGGGNVGIYPDNGMVRAAVISQTTRHHCLIFPQSALQSEPALVNGQVTVWCRDATSQAILSKSGVRTDLVPDISLYMDDLIPKVPSGEGVFYIRRTPGVDAEAVDHGRVFESRSADLTFICPLDQIIATLTPFELVISDRLHGGLIALMMRKKVIFMPVAYHKIKSFYSTWLKNEAGAAFVENQERLLETSKTLQFATTDFASLFCRHADPAFERFLLHA